MHGVQVPTELGDLDRLAWCSLAGNPACAAPRPALPIPALDMSQLHLQARLGDGASGDVFAAQWEGSEVAIKIFRSDVSPDGHAQDEIEVATCLAHPNLVRYGSRRKPHHP